MHVERHDNPGATRGKTTLQYKFGRTLDYEHTRVFVYELDVFIMCQIHRVLQNAPRCIFLQRVTVQGRIGWGNRATRKVIISTETHNSVRIAHREGILALLDELMASAT